MAICGQKGLANSEWLSMSNIIRLFGNTSQGPSEWSHTWHIDGSYRVDDSYYFLWESEPYGSLKVKTSSDTLVNTSCMGVLIKDLRIPWLNKWSLLFLLELKLVDVFWILLFAWNVREVWSFMTLGNVCTCFCSLVYMYTILTASFSWHIGTPTPCKKEKKVMHP